MPLVIVVLHFLILCCPVVGLRSMRLPLFPPLHIAIFAARAFFVSLATETLTSRLIDPRQRLHSSNSTRRVDV